MRRDTLRRLLIAALAASTLTGLFFACFEKRTFQEPRGYSKAARRNAYLAYERLMAAMGHEVVSLDGPAGLDTLPPAYGTLVIPTQRRTFPAETSRRLLDWVEAGGSLIVTSYSIWDDPTRNPDPILDPFGLQQYVHPVQNDEEKGDADEQDAPTEIETGAADEAEGAEDAEDEPVLVWDVCEAHVRGREQPLRVRFYPRWYWLADGVDLEWHIEGAGGMHLAMLRHGRGTITAVTDSHIFENDHIGGEDHAELLVRLARVDGRPGPVWIVISEHWPGLWSQATRYAMPVLVSFACLVVAALWRASRPFGPKRPGPPPERRRWLEHLDAVGRFHWQDDHGRALLEPARACVQRLLERRHPGWARLAGDRRVQRIAETAGLPAAQVAVAMNPHAHASSEAHFVAIVATLERIRASL